MVEDNLLSISESLIGQGVEVHTSNPSTRETEAEDHDPVLKKKKNPTTTKNSPSTTIERILNVLNTKKLCLRRHT
jgi:short-subunit dehydrogenase